MKFNIITIFPQIFDSYFKESILKRAQEKKLIKISVHNLRDFTTDKHKKSGSESSAEQTSKAGRTSTSRKVDDSPYGGGPGMVIKIEPVFRAVQFLKSKIKNQKSKIRNRIILFSTRGKKFDQKIAQRLAKYDQLILICGRYEGVDERVAKYIADEEISVGDFVLSGGELAAMILVEAVSRFVPGVLGKKESLETIKGSYPTYTRPEVFKSSKKVSVWRVPKVLLSGNHQKIEEWRKKLANNNYKC